MVLITGDDVLSLALYCTFKYSVIVIFSFNNRDFNFGLDLDCLSLYSLYGVLDFSPASVEIIFEGILKLLKDKRRDVNFYFPFPNQI